MGERYHAGEHQPETRRRSQEVYTTNRSRHRTHRQLYLRTPSVHRQSVHLPYTVALRTPTSTDLPYTVALRTPTSVHLPYVPPYTDRSEHLLYTLRTPHGAGTDRLLSLRTPTVANQDRQTAVPPYTVWYNLSLILFGVRRWRSGWLVTAVVGSGSRTLLYFRKYWSIRAVLCKTGRYSSWLMHKRPEQARPWTTARMDQYVDIWVYVGHPVGTHAVRARYLHAARTIAPDWQVGMHSGRATFGGLRVRADSQGMDYRYRQSVHPWCTGMDTLFGPITGKVDGRGEPARNKVH